MSNSLRDQLLGLGYKPVPAPEKPLHKPANAQPSNERAPNARPPRDARTERPRGERDRPASPRPDGGKPRPGADRRSRPDTARPGGARPDTAVPGRSRPDAPRPGGKPDPATTRARREEMDLGKAYALRAQTEKQERIAAELARQEEARLRREARATLATFLAGKVLNDAAAEIARHFPYGGKIKRIHVTADQLQSLNRGDLGVLQQDGRYLLVDRATLDAAEAIFAPSVALRVDPDAPAGDDPYADPAYQVPDDLVW